MSDDQKTMPPTNKEDHRWQYEIYKQFRKQPAPQPLLGFLEAAKQLTKVANTIGHGQRLRDGITKEYVTTCQLMTFWDDLIARVELIQYCYQRLCDLPETAHKLEEKSFDEGWMDLHSPFITGINMSTVSPETRAAKKKWQLETDAVTFLIHYELKSITDLLHQQQIETPDDSELEYLSTMRDKLLAHPGLHALLRSPRTSYGVPYDGKAVSKNIASLSNGHIPWEYYRDQIPGGKDLDYTEERTKNETFLRTKQPKKKLTPAQRKRLLAFGARAPQLDLALQELSTLLEQQALKKINKCYDEAVKNHGFQRF